MAITRPVARVDELIVPEYYNSVNLIKYIKVFAEELEDLHIALEDSMTKRLLDNAEGANLDVIGIIVGRKRGAFRTIGGEYFGFEKSIGGGTFGTVGDDEVGRVFRSESDVEVVYNPLDDESYRRHILAKIIINHRRITVPTVIRVVQLITNFDKVHITDGNGTFNIHIPRELEDDEKLLLSEPGFVPKPPGISVTFSDINGSFS